MWCVSVCVCVLGWRYPLLWAGKCVAGSSKLLVLPGSRHILKTISSRNCGSLARNIPFRTTGESEHPLILVWRLLSLTILVRGPSCRSYGTPIVSPHVYDNWAVRWEALLRPRQDGWYQFRYSVNRYDTGRVWIDNVKVCGFLYL